MMYTLVAFHYQNMTLLAILWMTRSAYLLADGFPSFPKATVYDCSRTFIVIALSHNLCH